jgi:uncharacterized protein
MEQLYEFHEAYIKKTKLSYKRYLLDTINWDAQLIAIKGPKGVGKTTLILQKIKELPKTDIPLYISMDSIAVKSYTLFEIASYHIQHGGTHLFIDEIHKYADWSREIKTIYDLYPDLKIVFSGSSILQIYKSYADLSRRVVSYNLEGLSFREFIFFETGQHFESNTLQQIITSHQEIAAEITTKINVLPLFKAYLQYGYYPFYKENKSDFANKLEQVVNNALDVDLPFMLEINVHNIFKLKKLLVWLATELPFQPNISKLAASLELNRNTLNTYLYYLEESKLLQLLQESGKSYSTLTKPEKIFLHNTNLIYAITKNKGNVGTEREIFFFNQLSAKHKVHTSKVGDFMVDEKLIFEVGGAHKTFTQIANTENSYLALDEIAVGNRNKIPLWLFGFLY